MDRSTALSSAEVVGIATAAATALGTAIIALGRSQTSSQRERRHIAWRGRTRARSTDPKAAMARIAVGQLLARYPEVRAEVERLLEKTASGARPTATAVTAAATERTSQLRASGQTAVERFQETVVPAAAETLHTLLDRAHEVRHKVEPAPAAAAVVAPVKQTAAVAAERTASGTRDLIGTLAWLAAAGTIIYVALLDSERRQQVRSFVVSAATQIQTLIRDFQGYEDEY